ncbi:MAG: PAS domain-containing protein [Deltaproteobacteria bacterium]|nr:PAS domain-containing protein [Deltaproteobacteria bacterium]
MTELQLWESRQKLQLVLDNIPQYVFWKDRDSVYQGCNRNFAVAAGVGEPEQIVGKTDYDLPWTREEADWYRQCDREVMESAVPRYHIAESQQKAGGGQIWIDTNKVPLLDSLGKVVGILGTYEDITERKRQEEALKKAVTEAEQARDKIAAILRSVADGLVVVDPMGRIELMNRGAEKIAGLAPDQGCSRPLEAVFSSKILPQQIAAALKGRKNCKPVEWSLDDEGEGGKKSIQAVTSRIQNKSGETTGTITLLRDITREREIDRMKNEFIATAAHELRTPLTTVMGFSELLIDPEQFGIAGEEQKKEFLTAIHESACRLSAIVSDLLDLSRVQSGRPITINRALCDITLFLRRQLEKFQSEKVRRPIVGHFPPQPVPMLIDAAKLEQVVDNLISNAVKFSPERTPIHFSGEISGDCFRIVISDQGIGMSPEQVERVFDKFYRADTSDTAPEGLGLGMAIAKNIVEAHGGRIWLESAPGVGTKAIFTLPIQAPAA